VKADKDSRRQPPVGEVPLGSGHDYCGRGHRRELRRGMPDEFRRNRTKTAASLL